MVEVVSVTTRSNLRACRFQHFPWGRGRHASIPNYNHKAVDKLVLGGAEATQKIWYFYANNISRTSYIVSKCFRKKASTPKLKKLVHGHDLHSFRKVRAQNKYDLGKLREYSVTYVVHLELNI